MILVDFNQVVISSVVQHLAVDKQTQLNEGFVRHMALNTLRSHAKKFKMKYGKVVVCCDAKHYWRKDKFSFYKANRKKDREKSGFDWDLMFGALEMMREEIRENLPYKVIQVDGAEADDIIAVLAIKYSPHEDVLVVSSDKDFAQLQKFKGVAQYSPYLKRFIQNSNPEMFLKEQIIRGDFGDGVPNILSADNVFSIGERQKAINSKKLVEWLEQAPEVFCTSEEARHGWARNKALIDLECVPDTIQKEIIKAYDAAVPQSRTKLLNYLVAKRLKLLMESINDF